MSKFLSRKFLISACVSACLIICAFKADTGTASQIISSISATAAQIAYVWAECEIDKKKGG